MSSSSIHGGKKPSNLSVLLIIFIAFAAGYTVADFPNYFLDFFKTPIGQFLVYFPVIYVTYKNEEDFYWTDMVFKSLLMVLIIRLIKKH